MLARVAVLARFRAIARILARVSAIAAMLARGPANGKPAPVED
jgi:hypothetical protein